MSSESGSASLGFWPRLFAATQVIHWRNVTVMLVLGVGAIFMMLPFLWMFSASFRPMDEPYRLPPSFLPDRFSLDAYAAVLDSSWPFMRMYWNSFVVAVATTVGVVATSATAAFAFSRLRFPGKTALFATLLVGLMVPPALVLIPLFFGFAYAGLLDTLWALILPSVASPLGIFMMRQFMASQPREYEEAAFVDGASYATIFFRISLPQMGPPIAALAVITFTQSWNNFVVPLVLIRRAEMMTLPVGLQALTEMTSGYTLSAIMAAVTMTVVPLFIVFLIAQRFIIEGITHTGIKG